MVLLRSNKCKGSGGVTPDTCHPTGVRRMWNACHMSTGDADPQASGTPAPDAVSGPSNPVAGPADAVSGASAVPGGSPQPVSDPSGAASGRPDAVSDAPESSEAIARARAARDSGRSALARDLLADHVATTHDPAALTLLGEVLYEMGDLAGAGCAWFGTSARGEQVSEATQAWRTAHRDDLARMWRSLPEPVRKESHLPKVEALHAKAFPSGPAGAPAHRAEPSRGATGAASTPAAVSSAPGRSPAPASPTSAVTSEPAASSRPAGSPTPAGPPQAGASTSPPKAGASTSLQARSIPPERGEAPSTASPKEPKEHRVSMSAEPPRHHAERRPGPPPRKPASGSAQGEGGSGFDAARLIAWVLAAFFVFCAVVGLITILGWLVPGG